MQRIGQVRGPVGESFGVATTLSGIICPGLHGFLRLPGVKSGRKVRPGRAGMSEKSLILLVGSADFEPATSACKVDWFVSSGVRTE
jgi:hypothetical protein